MNIGENILKMRKEKGITQEQLGDVLCISAGAVSKWETEASIPDISMLPKIANFFGVSIDRLFDFKLTESETPENILKRAKELAVGFNYDESTVRYDSIKIVNKCDEAISILTDACVKFPNNYELKAQLCWYKHVDASKFINDPESYKKAERGVLDELNSITRLTADKDINNICYSTMCQIYLALEEYDNAIETAKKANPKDDFQLGYNHAVITSLVKQNKKEEAEKRVHNITYMSLMQIYNGIMNCMPLEKDFEKMKKINLAIINLFKIFSEESPGPFDFYLSENYKMLAVFNIVSGEYDESMRCFEESYNRAENFKIFSEKREITSDFLKYADKNKFLYNIPYDYKKYLLAVFDALEAENAKEYFALKSRDDFQKFIEKLKA